MNHEANSVYLEILRTLELCAIVCTTLKRPSTARDRCSWDSVIFVSVVDGKKTWLKSIDVLNRFLDANDPFHTVHIMKYIFPRQFHLHNVFTSIVDKGDTTQKFKDYTLRELEIAQLSLANSVRKERNKKLGVSKLPSIPRRLRGEAYGLVRRMQKQHYGCAYKKLLDYYCPTPVSYV